MTSRERLSSRVQARAGDLLCLVAALHVGGLAVEAHTGIESWVKEALGLCALAALWWRRRAPLPVAAGTCAAATVTPLAAGAALAGVYTVAAHHHSRRTAFVVAALYTLYLGAGAAYLALVGGEERLSSSALVGVALTMVAYGWGLAVSERARRAEADQHARMLAARQAERTRIAAEMHDALAHRLSMLSLHAGALELRPQAPPTELARAAGVVRSGAHQALTDLRAVIGVLRQDVPGDLAPQPSVADLDSLLAECRAAGMRIEVPEPLPDADTVPPALGRHVYRIVQEGLTNARKHAPGQPVRLTVDAAGDGGLTVEISNATAGPRERRVPGAGAGIVGLRERVTLLGGTLDRRHDAAEHRLRAWLPWPS